MKKALLILLLYASIGQAQTNKGILIHGISGGLWVKNGNIGIGLTTPSFGLHVQRTIGANKDSVNLQTSTSTRQMLVIDTATGKFQRMTIPVGITSINSMTGPAISITAGTAITTSSVSNAVTIGYDRTNSDVPHTIANYLTDVNNSGTSETDLYSTTVGANKLLNNGQSIHFSGTIFLSDITATSQIRGYFAGIEFGNTGGIAIGATGFLRVTGEIIRKTSTTASASLKVEGIGLTTAYVNQFDLTGLDFTTTNIFKVTGTAGGGSGGSNDITAKPGKLTFQSN
jgi:hypothetical protein